jgi:hypothetical protein
MRVDRAGGLGERVGTLNDVTKMAAIHKVDISFF